mmetsp:Transcript_10355/g.15237  ORF Transcript_10355/g.15237 Transcript_10355/m.15237 type:complete len:205 (-) Transcript_10355:58-672(-)
MSQLSSCSYIPIIVPVGIPASTLEDPSSGSKTTTYLSDSSITTCFDPPITSTGASSSSDASTPSFPVNLRARLRTLFVITSSFFWSSPWTLTFPSYPSVSDDGSWERFTKLLIALQAVSIAPNRVVSSCNSGLINDTSVIKRFKVIPVCSQTSSKTGFALVATFKAVFLRGGGPLEKDKVQANTAPSDTAKNFIAYEREANCKA